MHAACICKIDNLRTAVALSCFNGKLTVSTLHIIQASRVMKQIEKKKKDNIRAFDQFSKTKRTRVPLNLKAEGQY